MKVRKVTKSVCKFNTKRVILNKVTQHEKKYLLNCSVRVYQRITKLKHRASRYLSMFSCNRPMCLTRVRHTYTHIGPTPMYIDLAKH